jgi:hypothetical protein
MGRGWVAMGHGWVAVGGSVGVASGETNSPPGLFTGETVAVGVTGCGVAVAVLVACSVGVELVVGVQVADGVAVGCGVSVTRATRPSREGPSIRASAVRQAQTANTTRANRPPPAASNRRPGQRVCSLSAAL